MKKTRFWIIAIILLFITLKSALSFPVLTYERGVNISEAKDLVYSIPEEYFEYVDRIDFVNELIRGRYTYIDENSYYIDYYLGFAQTRWDRNHNCYNGRIWLYQFDKIYHELGHIYDWCFLKNDITTEEFADSFKIK